MIEVDPKCVDARWNLALAYVELGDETNARSQFAELLKLAPHDWKVRTYLGDYLMHLGRLYEAVSFGLWLETTMTTSSSITPMCCDDIPGRRHGRSTSTTEGDAPR